MPRQKVRENAFPALVGMAAMLAGIGQPLMTRPAGSIALAQGRRNRTLTNTDITTPAVETDVPKDEQPASTHHFFLGESSQHHTFISASQPELVVNKKKSTHFNPFTSSPSLEDLQKGKAFSVSRYIKHAHQKINKKITTSKSAKDLSVFDPKLTALGQSSVPTNTAPLSPALSHCSSSEEIIISQKHGRITTKLSTSFDSYDSSLSSDNESVNSATIPSTDDIPKLSLDNNRKLLLRSSYFRSEMQFLLALVDIATRLVIVPKPARMSALHAELTLLNHNLPAEICLPLWCPATTDKPFHHRIVRINPSDAVVLNSAERVE
jgi:phosphatidylinositol 4-kinase